jgi:hypothetical protein
VQFHSYDGRPVTDEDAKYFLHGGKYTVLVTGVTALDYTKVLTAARCDEVWAVGLDVDMVWRALVVRVNRAYHTVTQTVMPDASSILYQRSKAKYSTFEEAAQTLVDMDKAPF